MPTARLLTVSRGIPCISEEVCLTPPGCNPPPVGRPRGVYPTYPLDADLLDADPLCMQTPPPHKKRTFPVNRMADASKNITLPQTSFAGGNNPQTQVKLTPNHCVKRWIPSSLNT